VGPREGEHAPAEAVAPRRPPAVPPARGKSSAAAALKRTVKAALKPKRAAPVKPVAQPLQARERRRRVESPPPLQAPSPAEAPASAAVESGPSFLGEWIRRQRRLLTAAALGFLGGVLIYAMLGPDEPPPARSAAAPLRGLDRAAAPGGAAAPAEATWPASGGRADAGYRPPAYPGAPAYPTAPAYPGGASYPAAPSYPSGPAFPVDDYRPWGRTDSRGERPREAPPGTLGGYPSAPSPYVPFSGGR
jgi:hypothetical protein